MLLVWLVRRVQALAASRRPRMQLVRDARRCRLLHRAALLCGHVAVCRHVRCPAPRNDYDDASTRFANDEQRAWFCYQYVDNDDCAATHRPARRVLLFSNVRTLPG